MPAMAIPEVFADLHFPKAGMDTSMGFEAQPVRPIADGSYARTAREGVNVRSFEPSTLRSRGGQRPGLVRYIADPVVAGWIIQQLDLIVSGGTAVQPNQAGRLVVLVAVSQGNVYYVEAGGTTWTAATNNTGNSPPLNFTGVLFSAVNQQKMWFADGNHWAYYQASNNTVNNWTASAGTLPVDSDGNKPRLICTWRGRTVLSGLLKDPQDWFMSAVDDPTNFDYSPASQIPTQAIAGINAPQGLVGDVITGLVPYTDDILIFLGDHSVYVMKGDPMAGGQIDKVSETIGGAWGQAWCQDPYGNVYFVSNRLGIYTMVPGQQPQRISQAIESELLGLDSGNIGFRMLWDDRFQGLHVFCTPLAQPTAGTRHFFFEQRTGAWWQDEFASKNFDPLTCVAFDGNGPNDRVALIGSWDGYVRSVDPDATQDDDLAIASTVVIGPFTTKNLDDVLLKDLQAVLGVSSGDVTFAVYVGQTAEAALTSEPVVSGTWTAGRNLNTLVRRAGYAVYVRISATNAWAMETIRARLATSGKVRRRGR